MKWMGWLCWCVDSVSLKHAALSAHDPVGPKTKQKVDLIIFIT